MQNLVIRADAGSRMGTGHVMRCFALAQAAIEQKAKVRFIGRNSVPWVRDWLNMSGVRFDELSGQIPDKENPQDILSQIRLAGYPSHDTWVVLDGYHFTASCHKAVKNAGYRVLVIDDYAHLPEYHCDVLLNQNLGSARVDYRGDIGLRLMGPSYALLRPEFGKARKQICLDSKLTPPQNILVSLGGGNFFESLSIIAEAMNIPEMAGCNVKIIQGAMDAADILRVFDDCPFGISVLERVDDMPGLLLGTDLCITAGGSTCWELCCLGVPFMTVVVAENQQAVAANLNDLHIARPFSKDSLQSALAGHFNTGFDLVDGAGAFRVVSSCISSPVECMVPTIF